MSRLSLVYLTSLLLITAADSSAQSRRPPFKFELTALDANSHRPRSTFALGERVVIRISLTNRGRAGRTIVQLPDHMLQLKLHSNIAFENPRVEESYIGGTGWARTSGNMTLWGDRPPRMMTLKPGQTVSETFELGDHFFWRKPAEEGTYTLTAQYSPTLSASVAVRVVFDTAKTMPLLERLAALPVTNEDDSLQRWAKASLELRRAPSISGYVRDSNGRPMHEARIYITGKKESNTETRTNGAYIVEMLEKNGTYTITPSIPYYQSPGEIEYTIVPASRTISMMGGNVTEVNFTATSTRASKNVALEDEGAKATASSIKDHDFETENVINGFRYTDGWETGSAGWNDGTPNVFPDWLEVNFGRVHRINWVNVFTVADDFQTPRDPELKDTFSHYGITDFDVQYWTGRKWRTVPNGAIRNNRNVWRTISFPAVATNKIRVLVLNAVDGESRIAEVEAFHFNDLPQAKIVSQTKAETNSPVHFRTEFSDRDGTIQHYELDFGDDSNAYEWHFDPGKPADKPRLTHGHIFKEPGAYNVRLRVVDDSNEATEATLVVTITDRSASKVQTRHPRALPEKSLAPASAPDVRRGSALPYGSGGGASPHIGRRSRSK
jgi:PKD domain-containing protein/carboxypeptidase family protein